MTEKLAVQFTVNSVDLDSLTQPVKSPKSNNQICGGSVFKPKHCSKNLHWRAEVWHRNFPGDKKHWTSKNFATRKAAEVWKNKQLSQFHKHNIPVDAEVTLSEWLEYSRKAFFINLRDSTRTSYEGYFCKHVKQSIWGRTRLIDLTACDLQAFENYLLNSGSLKSVGGLSPKTVRSIMLDIRKSLRFAVGAGIIDKNPADFIVLPQIPDKPVEYLSLAEIKKLSDTSKNEPWGIFFPLAFLSACRIGELAALKKSSVQNVGDQYFLSIEGSLNRVKDYSGESSKATILKIGPTKNGKTRKIPLLPALVQAINLHFFRQQEESLKLYGKTLDDPYMFSADGGLHFVDPSTLRNWSKKMSINAGITRRFTPHMLRKSLATLGTNTAHIDLKNISSILGNGVNVCANHYIGSDLSTKAAAVLQLQPFCDVLLA